MVSEIKNIDKWTIFVDKSIIILYNSIKEFFELSLTG